MALQVSHTADDLHSVSKNAAVSGATAPKPPTNICALIARFIVAHIVKEAKRSRSQAILLVLFTEEMRRLSASDEAVRFLPIRKKPLEDYNGLGNR
jgi:hypothetical protein